MRVSAVLVLATLGCALAQEEAPVVRSKRTAHFLLHQFADLLGYDIIPKAAVVTDIRSRLGLPSLQGLGQQAQNPQTQAPPNTTTMGSSTTTRQGSTPSQAPGKTPTTSAQAPPSSEGPVRLPLPLNILNRLQPTVPILNPAVPPMQGPTPAARLEQPPVALQHTNLSLNFLFSKVPPSAPSDAPEAPSAPSAVSAPSGPSGPFGVTASGETPTGPSAEDDNPPRFVEDNYVFNPRDANDDDDFNPNLAFSGWRPPRPEDFSIEESSEVKYNPAPSARSIPLARSSTPARLDPVALAHPHSNYISAFVPGPQHRRRSATSQLSFRTKGSQYGFITYH